MQQQGLGAVCSMHQALLSTTFSSTMATMASPSQSPRVTAPCPPPEGPQDPAAFARDGCGGTPWRPQPAHRTEVTPGSWYRAAVPSNGLWLKTNSPHPFRPATPQGWPAAAGERFETVPAPRGPWVRTSQPLPPPLSMPRAASHLRKAPRTCLSLQPLLCTQCGCSEGLSLPPKGMNPQCK